MRTDIHQRKQKKGFGSSYEKAWGPITFNMPILQQKIRLQIQSCLAPKNMQKEEENREDNEEEIKDFAEKKTHKDKTNYTWSDNGRQKIYCGTDNS